jgi:hypothetical protein
MAKKNIGDIIKSNSLIKSKLISRFLELDLTNKDIALDATEKGYKIQESCLSRYLNKSMNVAGSLSQEQILWLCMRYCIPVRLVLRPYRPLKRDEVKGVPPGTLVPYNEEYDESRAIKNLAMHFGYNPNPRKEEERPTIWVKGKQLGKGVERTERIIENLGNDDKIETEK